MKAGLLVVYFLSLLVSIEGQIRKFPAGEDLVNRISEGTVRFLHWRAGANPMQEVRGLTSFFGWTAFALSIAFIVVRYLIPESFPEKLSLVSFGALALWSLFTLFRDYKKDWGRLALLASTAIAWPWLLPAPDHPSLDQIFAPARIILQNFSLPATDVIIMVILSALSLCAVALMELVALSVPMVVFLSLWVSAKISSRFIRHKPVWLYHAALTYYVAATMYYLTKSELGWS